MPALNSRSGGVQRLIAALAVTCCWFLPATPARAAGTDTAAPRVDNSALDALLFYQLLIAEIELRDGQPGAAFQAMLEAARRSRDEQLFRHATEIALKSRAGDQALAAIQAWRQTLPASSDAVRYQIQMLVALNRSAETIEPMRALIDHAAPAEREALIVTLPRYFARSTDKLRDAGLLEQALQPYLAAPATRVAARIALSRAWLVAPDPAKALELARSAQAADAGSEAVAMLGLELLPGMPDAEALVKAHLAARPDSHAIRFAYARALTGAQRYGDAVAQLDTLTHAAPRLAAAWLTLGALQLELRHPAEATGALQRFLALADEEPPKPSTATAARTSEGDEDEMEADAAATGESAEAGAEAPRTQAWLLLAQAAEQQGDFKAAEAWLSKVDSPQRALEVQTRRASMIARQGRVDEARQLIRLAPERTTADARAKLMAEAQILRDVKRWAEADAVLGKANEAYPGDADLLYEQSMVAEKLDRIDEMERLLRKVIELKPDHHHAYNALGYSLAERNLRLPEAKALIQKALSLSPGEPFITDSLGWVEYRMGNPQEALRLLRGAYQSRPDPEIAAHLGEVLWVQGQRDEARRVWREGRNRDGANDVLRETLARLRVDL